MLIENLTVKAALSWLNQVWAKSLIALLMFAAGIHIGEINAEGRIVSDCKFANSFRVDIQAFSCQRKI